MLSYLIININCFKLCTHLKLKGLSVPPFNGIMTPMVSDWRKQNDQDDTFVHPGVVGNMVVV